MSYENKGSIAPKVIVTSEPDRSGNYICNGASDETDINRAISELTSGRTWKEKVLLKGDFTIDDPIIMDSYTILELDGKVTLANGASCDILTATNEDWFEILGGEWDGNQASATGDLTGFLFTSCDNVLLRDVYIHDVHGDDPAWGRGLWIVGTSKNIDVIACRFEDNHKAGAVVHDTSSIIKFDGCTIIGNGVEGIALSGTDLSNVVHDCTITNCYFEDNGGEIPASGNDIDLYKFANDNIVSNNIIKNSITDVHSLIGLGHDGPARPCHNNLIVDNILKCEGEVLRGIILWGGSSNNIIRGNYIYSSTQYGIALADADNNYNLIEGNYLFNCESYGIHIDDDQVGNVVRGNYLYNPTTRGIDVDNNLAVIDGNVIYSVATGIYIEDGDDIMITNNRFIDCTTPIDCDRAAAVRPMIMGNNWEGCTNDAAVAGATNERITSNIDKNGAWWATGDDPA